MDKRIRRIGKIILEKLPFGNQFVKYLKGKLFCVYKTRLIPDKSGVFYKLNTEAGLMDVDIRSADGIWEYPGMIVTNQAIGDKFLTPDVCRVINIGSGVGTFEDQNAKNHPNVQFLACEMDKSSTEWAKANRSYPNVDYCSDSMSVLLKKLGGGKV